MRYIARNRLPFGHEELSAAFLPFYAPDEILGDLNERIKSYIGCSDVKLFNKGRTALYIALRAINVGPGDSVICPSLSCLVVPEMILKAGARPVLIDVDPETFTIDVEKIKEELDNTTKAIIPIHLFGHPAEMKPIMDIANDNNIYVIEDSAQAMGAKYKNKKVGSFGHASIFSLGHGKNISTMEGGILTINDESLRKSVNKIYNSLDSVRFNKAFSNFIKQVGYSILSHPSLYILTQSRIDKIAESRDKRILKNTEDLYHNKYFIIQDEISRINELTASIAMAQFKKLNYFNKRRIENAEFFSKRIKHEGFLIPRVANNCKHVFLRYAIRIQKNELGLTRNEIAKIFKSNRIDVETPYLYVKEHNKLYWNFTKNKSFEVSDELINSIICLPVHPCMNEYDLKRVLDIISQFGSISEPIKSEK